MPTATSRTGKTTSSGRSIVQNRDQTSDGSSSSPSSSSKHGDDNSAANQLNSPRPRHGGNADVDEKVLRRRMQYKLHQRRHRAKQKERTLALEQEVSALVERVARLQAQRQALSPRNVISSRGMAVGAPARLAREFFRLFEYGFTHTRVAQQIEFMRSAMAEGIAGPDYQGLDTLIEQFHLYASLFALNKYVPKKYEAVIVNETVIVIVYLEQHMRPRRDCVPLLCPNITGSEELVQEVIGRNIVVHGKWQFMFDASGAISYMGADMDFVHGLQESLGSLHKAAMFMRGAQMSFTTGQIARACQESLDPRTSGRHELAYLLS